MSIDLEIQKECRLRGISRLCHFTPSRNLAHILAGNVGILATAHLENSERHVFNATDLQRLDGHKNHISCSIEYPNGWYFSRTRSAEFLFKDWVVLLIMPDYLWLPETLFCFRNASAGYGRYIQGGIAGFRLLYESSVAGAGTRIIRRSSRHLPACPTDNQAEVLVPDCIKLSNIIGIVVQNEDQARNELCRLRLQKLEIEISIYIAPAFYDKHELSSAISGGCRPEEKLFDDGGCYGQ